MSLRSALLSIPVLGPLLRSVAALAKLPAALQSFGTQLSQLHQRADHVDRALSGFAHETRTGRAEDRAALAAPLAAHADRIAHLDAWAAARDVHVAQLAAGAEEQRAFTAASFAQDRARLDTLAEELAAQGALVSTVQRLAARDGDMAREAKAAAEQARLTFEGHLPDFLNAITVHEVATAEMRQAAAANAEVRSTVEAVKAVLEEHRAALAAAGQRIDAETGRADALHRQLGALESGLPPRLEALEAALPARLQALEAALATQQQSAREIATGAAGRVASAEATLANYGESIRYLLNRVEFVRRETLFEMRYGASNEPADVEPRVVDEAKVAAARKAGLRVNVGCGHIPLEGYVNVDRRALPGVDVVAEANRMPFDPGTVKELMSAHLIEHFPEEQLKRELLPYWKSLLAKGGQLRAVVPDAEAMLREYGKGAMPWGDLREVTFGGQDYAGDFHYNMYTPASLEALLRAAGFKDVSFPATGRRNGQCYEFEVVAR